MLEVETVDGNVIRLVGEANIHHAEELHAALVLVAKTKPEEVFLDLGRLTALDTAGAQVLMAFKRSLPKVKVHSCPTALRDFLLQAGLASLLV